MSTDPSSVEEVAREAMWKIAAASAGIGTYVLHLPSSRGPSDGADVPSGARPESQTDAHTRDGGDLVADDQLLTLTGLQQAGFTGHPQDVYDRIHPEDRQRVIDAVHHAASTGAPYQTQYRVQLPAGQLRWLSASGQAVTGYDGTVTALVGVAYDVTALRQATTRISQVLQAMPVGYLAMDADWRITTLNDQAVAILGSREELVGQQIWQAFPATVGTAFEAGYRRAATSGQLVTFDAYYPEPLDAWFEVRAAAQDGGVALYFTDITARQLAQDQAQRNGARLMALGTIALGLADAEHVGDLITVMAEQGLAALGADGGSIAVPDPADDQVLRSYITASLAGSREAFSQVALSAQLPVAVAARTGQRVLLGDAAACAALSAHVVEANAATGCQAWASLPLRAGGEVLGVLTAGWAEPQVFDAAQLDLLETYAAQCAQALARLVARDGEHAATAAAQEATALAQEATLAAQEATITAQGATIAAQEAARAARLAETRQAVLVGIAQDLARARDEQEVLAVVAGRGSGLLGAAGAGLCLVKGPALTAGAPPASDGDTVPVMVRILSTADFADDVRAAVQQVPADFPMPIVHTAVSGTGHFLADRRAAVAAFPGARALYEAAQMQASAAVPLLVGTGSGQQLLGSLSVGFTTARQWSHEDRELLAAFASLTAQAVQRIHAREAEGAALAAERVASAQVAQFSETLQRSLLTSPPEPDHLHIAVRYAPATAQAQVGGDWYDAFLCADGATHLVIGDVTGHDRTAAAAMGQLRNLLRGIAYAATLSPAGVLSTLDAAAHDLGVDTTATVLLARLEQSAAQRRAGQRLLRWSNAGHLPPLLIAADGTTSYLQADSDLLVGVDPTTPRHEHTMLVEPGTTVLLYTDGLVERRRTPLQDGLDWLAGAAQQLADLPVDDLCDALLEQVGSRLEDDVALLAVRAYPEDQPRPPEAGPGDDEVRRSSSDVDSRTGLEHATEVAAP